MGGRLIAFNEQSGYRPILVVQTINHYHQSNATKASVVLHGEQVLLPFTAYGVNTGTDAEIKLFLSTMIGQRAKWSQLRNRPHMTFDRSAMTWPKLPLIHVATGEMTLIASGRDPIKGYWLQFEGATIPLFNQPRWWDASDDDYLDYDDPNYPGDGY